MMKFSTAIARILAVSVLMAIAGSVAGQQAYPSKPIRFITPFPPGGSTSILARMIAQKLTENWGQPVIVENRGGGNTIIGAEAVAKSPPDGYTIMLTTVDHLIVPNLIPTPYDSINDFAAIATVAISENILMLHPSVPVSNLQEFIAFAKARPGQLNYATAGNGTVSHLAGESLNIMAGIKMQHIPYKGGGPAFTDLIGGQVQAAFTVPINAMPHIKSGKLKAIAITGETRLSVLPQVSTFTEAGLPGVDVKVWYGVFSPAGTPKAVIDRLSTEIGQILSMPDSREKLISLGIKPFISTPEQFAAFLKAERTKLANIIKTSNIRLD